MPLFTIALTLLLGLTLVGFGLTRRKLRGEEIRSGIRKSLELAAEVAVAATEDAFGTTLDYSDESIAILDTLVQKITSPLELTDALFVLASYIGETLVRSHDGQWQIDESLHPYPFVLFQNRMPASPFDLIRSKCPDPENVSLVTAYHELIAELDQAPSIAAA